MHQSRGTVQETGSACRPVGWKVKLPDRHARQSVRRLKAVAVAVHSAATFIKPRSRNPRTPICSLIIPNTGSTSCFLSSYASLAAAVDIQARWAQRRVVGAYGLGAANASLRVHTPKAGHSRQVAPDVRYTRFLTRLTNCIRKKWRVCPRGQV